MSTPKPPIDTTLHQSPVVLRALVRRLEHDLFAAHEQIRRVSDEAAVAKKSAADAWTFVRQLRGAPYRG